MGGRRKQSPTSSRRRTRRSKKTTQTRTWGARRTGGTERSSAETQTRPARRRFWSGCGGVGEGGAQDFAELAAQLWKTALRICSAGSAVF